MTTTLADRFWQKVDRSDPTGCWFWTGALTRGYGSFNTGGKRKYAHRLAYEELVGPIPDGLQIDHLCRVPNCVNPEHLEPVTQRENLRRGNSPPAMNAAKTTCPQGHPYDVVNEHGHRGCKTCKTLYNQEYWAKNKK